MNAQKVIVALVALSAMLLAMRLVLKSADRRADLQLIDVSDPTQPAILGHLDTPGGSAGVAISGKLAYVADTSSGLMVIDVSNPSQPTIVASLDTPGGAASVAVSGTVAYLADRNSGF